MRSLIILEVEHGETTDDTSRQCWPRRSPPPRPTCLG